MPAPLRLTQIRTVPTSNDVAGFNHSDAIRSSATSSREVGTDTGPKKEVRGEKNMRTPFLIEVLIFVLKLCSGSWIPCAACGTEEKRAEEVSAKAVLQREAKRLSHQDGSFAGK